MSTLPDITTLENSLVDSDAMMGAAEAHGALCGMLCARGAVDLSDWMRHVLGDEPSQREPQDLSQQLLQLHRATLEQINDAVGDFHLLVPDDAYSLSQRVESLAEWCQGYVYGLAAGGVTEDSELPEDTRELLADFIEISRVGMDDVLDAYDDEDEVAYMEISEYVRTGALLINEELQPLKTTYTLQ